MAGLLNDEDNDQCVYTRCSCTTEDLLIMFKLGTVQACHGKAFLSFFVTCLGSCFKLFFVEKSCEIFEITSANHYTKKTSDYFTRPRHDQLKVRYTVSQSRV